MDDKDMYVISGSNDVTLSIDSTALPSFTIDDLQSIDLSGNIDWNNMGASTVLTTGTDIYHTGYGYHPAGVNIGSDGITMQQDTDLKIGDRSLKDFMDKVEDQLAILRPAPELEEKWDKLKELRRQYEECKQDILEKEKIMKILKED